IITAAGLDAFGMEFFDGVVAGSAERDVGAGAFQPFVQIEPERGLTLRPEASAVLVLRAQYKAERRQRRGIEAHGSIKVADFDSDVVVHGDLRLTARTSREMAITKSVEGEAFLENLALPPRGLTELERRDPGSAMEGADKIGEIAESDVIGDVGHGLVIF